MKKGEQNHRRESQKYEHEIKIEPKDEAGEEGARRTGAKVGVKGKCLEMELRGMDVSQSQAKKIRATLERESAIIIIVHT